MFRLKNKPVLSSPSLINEYTITDSAQCVRGCVYMRKADAPAKDSLAFLEIYSRDHENDSPPPDYIPIISHWVYIEEVLYINLSSDDEEVIVKVLIREHKWTLTNDRFLQNHNVVHIGDHIVSNQLAIEPTLINPIDPYDWTGIEDLLETNHIKLTSTEYPPLVPKQLFWMGLDFLDALSQILKSHCCRIITTNVETPTITDGEHDTPTASVWTNLKWKKRSAPSLPPEANVSWLSLSFPNDLTALTNTVMYRTLDSYANSHQNNYVHHLVTPENDVLCYPHNPVLVVGDVDSALDTYLNETNINQDFEYWGRTKFIAEDYLDQFEWSEIKYSERDGNLEIEVFHRTFNNPTVNPTPYQIENEWATAIVTTGGSEPVLEQMTDLALNWDYPDGFILSGHSGFTGPRENPAAGDRIYMVRTGTNFHPIGVDKKAPHLPIFAGNHLNQLVFDYNGLESNNGTTYTLPIDSANPFWDYDITVSPVFSDSPQFTLSIDDEGVASGGSGVKYLVTFTLDKTEAEILTHLQTAGYPSASLTLAEQEALAQTLFLNSEVASFYVVFPVSTYRIGFWCIPITVNFSHDNNDFQTPSTLDLSSPVLPSSTRLSATRTQNPSNVTFSSITHLDSIPTDTGDAYHNSQLESDEFVRTVIKIWRELAVQNVNYFCSNL